MSAAGNSRRVHIRRAMRDVADAIDALEDAWNAASDARSPGAEPIGHQTLSSVQHCVANVFVAVGELEREWRESAPEQIRRRRMTLDNLAECLLAYRFRIAVIERMNRLFSQRALAERYHVSKRCIEDNCRGKCTSFINRLEKAGYQ